MKKSLLWIAVLLLSISMVAAFSLYGCKAEEVAEEEAAEEEEVAEEEAAEEEEEEAVVANTQVVYNSFASDPEPRRIDEMIVSMFEEANPTIDVIHRIVAHEDFKQAIRAYLTASTPPDVLR